MSVKSFMFAKVIVRDADKLATFYLDQLGFRLAFRTSDGEGENAFVECFLSAGPELPPQLVLMSYPARAAPAPGEAIVALMVDDLDQTIVDVERGGGKVAVPAFDVPEHQMRMAYVTDPEGHTLEFICMNVA